MIYLCVQYRDAVHHKSTIPFQDYVVSNYCSTTLLYAISSLFVICHPLFMAHVIFDKLYLKRVTYVCRLIKFLKLL